MIDADEVTDWLQNNPDFFHGREQLLCQMQLNHPCGDAESLLSYQLQLLRGQVKEQEDRYQELLANARENEKRLRRVERLLVCLLETETAEELVSVLAERLQNDFGLPYLKFWSYTNLNSLPRADEEIQKKQRQLLGKQQACCLSLQEENLQVLGLEDSQARSAALCLLSHTRPLGLMVLAHPDPLHFRYHQDTLFVEYLGSVVSRLLSKDRRQFAARQA
ncbi:hypothetical protein SAMN05660443_2159 [Marinospirillum celere]|uniref:DUF484 domain-containing protein n=1 Tax=Marinospirillum celere TaxID=1122252 RepID=A0A1I1I2F1_9GAMM|nr:DUF484 family protein [Marinospirillum celere]SFC30487.1 hypothetical protein SAMN05660443_2159 [Marinospirillum celere]